MGSEQAVAARRVLVVDDNAAAAELLGLLLGERGHEVWLAHDGEEALEQARAARPQVVLLDLLLPGKSGYEVATELREVFGAEVRLVAVTGLCAEDAEAESRAAGFDDFATKGGDLDALLRTFGRLGL